MRILKNKGLGLILGCITILFLIIGYFIISYIKVPQELFSCNTIGVEDYCIDAEFKTTVDKVENEISDFSFPGYLRQGDFLYISKITIIKKSPITSKGEDKIYGATLKFNILPTGGHLEEVYPSNYGEFDTKIKREIDIGDIYVIKRMKNGEYYHYFNGERIDSERHWKIKLYRIGEWYIDFDIEGGNLTGWTILFNGRWHGEVFYVHPRHEIENTKLSDRSMVVGIISLLVILYIFTIEYLTNLALRIIDKKNNKSKRIVEILNKISNDISAQISKRKSPKKRQKK